MSVAVLDISDAQGGDIQWPLVRQSGVLGAWIKATEGVRVLGGSEQRFFRQNVAAAKAAGVRVGAYHYLRIRMGNGAVQDAVQQAVEFCDLLVASGTTLRPMVDVELKSNEGATPEQAKAAVHQFIATVFERLGVFPIVYTSPGEWASLKLDQRGDMIVASCPLWLATVGPQGSAFSGAPITPEPWKSAPSLVTGRPVPLLHQYTWTAHVPGIKPNVDMSHFFGTPADLVKLDAGGNFITRLVTSKAAPIVALVVLVGGASLLLFMLAERKDASRVLPSV